MKRFGKSVFFVTFIALVTAFFAGTAMAVGYTWDNDSGNGMWKDVTNWNPNGDHPGNGLGPVDTATFDALGGNITVAAPFLKPLMVLDVTTNNPVTIQFPGGLNPLLAVGGTLRVGDNCKLTLEGAAATTLGLGGGASATVDGTLIATGNVKLSAAGAIDFKGKGSVSFAEMDATNLLTLAPTAGKALSFGGGVLTANGNVKQSGESVKLSAGTKPGGNFDYTLDNGKLEVDSPASLEDGGKVVTVKLAGADPKLAFSGGGTLAGKVELGGTNSNEFSVASGKTVTISAVDRLSGVNAWDKEGAGVLEIDAKQTGAKGAVDVEEGVLRIGASDALDGAIDVSDKGTLELKSGVTYPKVVEFDTNSTLAVHLSGTPEATFGASFAMPSTVNGKTTVNAIGLKALLVPANAGKIYKVVGGDCSHFIGKVSLQADGTAVTAAMADVTAGAGGITVKVKAAPATSGDTISITGFPDDTSILYGVKDGKPQSISKSFTIVTTNGKSASVTFSPDLPDWIKHSKGKETTSGTNVTRMDTLTVTPKNAGESYQGKLVVKAGTAKNLERSFRVKKADETPGPKDPTTPGDDSYISAVGGGAMVPASPLKWELISYAPDNSNYRPVTITVSFWADQYPEHVQVATTGFIGDVRSEILDYRRNAPSAGMKEYVLRVHGRVASQALDYGGAAITSIHFRFPGESAATWTRYIVIPGNGIKLADMTKLSYDRYYDHGGGGCDAGFGLGGAIVLLAAAGAAALRKRG